MSVSISRICVSASTCSHGGGLMLHRFWRFSRSASQRGSEAGNGGLSGCVGPFRSSSVQQILAVFCRPAIGLMFLRCRCYRRKLTPNSSSRSSFWRGITVTNSISPRKASSFGVSPGGKGSAIVYPNASPPSGRSGGVVIGRAVYDYRRCRRPSLRMKIDAPPNSQRQSSRTRRVEGPAFPMRGASR